MKAISLRQPWAWLVAEGYKPIEFRWRSDKFRGECYIHASKTFDDYGYQWLIEHPELPGVEKIIKMMWCPKVDADFGAIIGKMTVVDCLPVEQACLYYPNEMWLTVCRRRLGDKAFIIQNPVHFLRHNYIPCKGKIVPLFFEPEVLEVSHE